VRRRFFRRPLCCANPYGRARSGECDFLPIAEVFMGFGRGVRSKCLREKRGWHPVRDEPRSRSLILEVAEGYEESAVVGGGEVVCWPPHSGRQAGRIGAVWSGFGLMNLRFPPGKLKAEGSVAEGYYACESRGGNLCSAAVWAGLGVASGIGSSPGFGGSRGPGWWPMLSEWVLLSFGRGVSVGGTGFRRSLRRGRDRCGGFSGSGAARG
jgi:hypothetical protein